MIIIDSTAVLLSLVCYLFGSIPTAFLILKFSHKKDITTLGSGNVGAMNSYDVTGSKSTGLIVFFIDFLKGIIPAFLFLYVFHFRFEQLILPFIAIIIGHNYSILIKFKGGRGLATSLGILIFASFLLPIYWGIIYSVSKLIKKDVHINSTIATILLPFMLLLSKDFINKFSFIGEVSFSSLMLLCSLICLVILIKHIKPLRMLFNKKL